MARSSEAAANASKSANEFGSIGVGLSEVELPASFKQRNAIETETATAELRQASRAGELPNSARHQIGGNFHFRREPLANKTPKHFNSDNQAFSKFLKSRKR